MSTPIKFDEYWPTQDLEVWLLNEESRGRYIGMRQNTLPQFYAPACAPSKLKFSHLFWNPAETRSPQNYDEQALTLRRG